MRRTIPVLVLLAMALATLPAEAANFGNYGTLVSTADQDHTPLLVAPSSLTGGMDTPRVCARTNTAVSGPTDDYYYLHWAADCTAGVRVGDIRLTAVSGGSAGTVVGSSSSDRGLGYDTNVGALLAGVGYLEMDGKPGHTLDDGIYYSADNTIDVTSGDLRLATVSANGVSNTAGTIVTSTSSSDVNEAGDNDGLYPDSTTLQSYGATFALQVIDNGDGVFDAQTDRVLLSPTGATTTLAIGQLPLNSIAGQTFGQKIKATTSDYDRRLTDLGALTIVQTNAVTTPVSDIHLFLHFPDNDGANDHVQVGDIVIKSGSVALGTRVSSPTNGAGETISASTTFVGSVFFLDVNGDNHYTPATDPVYWNRPATGFGGEADALGLTRNDVRLTSVTTGGSTYAAGTVVATADKDLSGFSGLAANDGLTGSWFLTLHNADISNHVELTTMTNARISGADAAWDVALDGAYVTTASTVGDTVVRLKAPPTLGNTKLDCDGAGGDHADCDATAGSLTDNGAFSTSGSTAITTWAATTSVYHDVGTIGTVDAGDTRIYHPSLAPAAVLAGDSDVGTTIVANTRVSVLTTDATDTVSDPYVLGDDVYWDADDSATINTNDVRLYHAWGGAVPAAGTAVSCTAGTYNFDCAATLSNPTKIRVTGGDATYTPGRSEYVYHSEDMIVNDEDFRFLDPDGVGALAAGSNVAAGDADTARASIHSGDNVYLSWCEGGACTAPTLLQVGDIEFGGSSSILITGSSSGFVPTVAAAPASVPSRYDRQQVGLSDDVFYVAFGTPGVSVNDVRLLAFDSTRAAGSRVGSSDTQELGAATTDSATGTAAALKYIDNDGIAGYTSGDFVILDLPNDLNGGAFGTYDDGDIRVTKVVIGSTTYAAGTIVKAGDSDVAPLSFGANNPGWTTAFFDEDRDTMFSTGDVLYAIPGAIPASGTLPLNSVRLSGPGGSTTTTPPTGGNGNPPSTTSPTTNPTDSTTSPTDDPDTPLGIVTSANEGLAQSLEVSREGDDNVLSWDAQAGVSGYQVWRSSSPFVLVTTLSEGHTSYTDEGAAANATYVVTAFVSHNGVDTGKYTDINDEDVPGNPDLEGKSPGDASPTPRNGAAPGLPLVALLVMLGIAVLVRRRF